MVIYREVQDINRLHTFLILVFFLLAIIAICAAGYQISNVSVRMCCFHSCFPSLFYFLCQDSRDLQAIVFSFTLAGFYLQQLFFYYLPGELLYEQVHISITYSFKLNW